jgi:hypothetical protein
VVFSAHDVAGNLGSSTQTIKIDTTPPTADFSMSPPNGSNGWYTSAVTVTPSSTDAISGIASQQVSLDSSNWSSSVTISTDGIYTVYSKATDNAGNSSSVVTKTVSLDTNPPVESLVLPPTTTGWYTSKPAITVNASDTTSGVATVEYSADGGSWAAALPTFSDGTHTVQALVTDKAGNSSTSTTSTIQVDATAPQSVFITPAEGSSVVAIGTFTLSGTTSDATSGVAGAEISLDGETTWSPLVVTGGSWSYVWDTGKYTNGTYQVYVRGTDNAGNIEHTAHITITVANQGPSVSITKDWVIWQAAAVKITTHVLPVVGAHISISHLGGYEVKSFDFTSSNLPYSFKWNGLTSKGRPAPFGLYTVRVEIWDGYGHHASASGTVWIPAPQPTSTATLAPSNTPTPTPVQPTQTSTPVRLTATHTITPTTGTTPLPIRTPTPKATPIPKATPEPTWPVTFTGSVFLLFLSLSFLDPRPAAWRHLARIKFNPKS